MLYKLREGLDEEGVRKLEMELDQTSRRIHHPLDQITTLKVDIIPAEHQPKAKAERQPPPGWKSEKEAFNSAMSVMAFLGKTK